MKNKTAVAVVSGGIDSVTLAHLLHSQGWNLHLLAFDYGQRHKKELEFAVCRVLENRHRETWGAVGRSF